jgi:hypothetical protein
MHIFIKKKTAGDDITVQQQQQTGDGNDMKIIKSLQMSFVLLLSLPRFRASTTVHSCSFICSNWIFPLFILFTLYTLLSSFFFFFAFFRD